MKARSPLVYSCSGCSSAAQLANQTALWLDRDEVAEMSCIADAGGGVTGLVSAAQSRRHILALDAFMLASASACLARAGVKAETHLLFFHFGVGKRKYPDFNQAEARAIYRVAVTAHALAQSAAVDDEELLDAP